MTCRTPAVVVVALALSGLLIGCQGKTQYVYTVKEAGTTLEQISMEQYGSDRYAEEIEKANPEVDPDQLKPGTKLVIPVVKGEEGEALTPAKCRREEIY